jgi:2'-5' RNA ligase
MRLFVAANLASDQLVQLRGKVEEAQLAAPVEGIRWLPETNWHATLAFIGEREPSELPDIESAIDQVVARFERLTVRPHRIQAMPHRSQPRLLALKAAADPPIQELYFQLGKALAIKDRQREFRFHVTVARFRELTGDAARAFNEAIKDLSMIEEKEWILPSVSLYDSTLSQEGASYRAIRTWNLVTST